jgi:hypothetical protein
MNIGFKGIPVQLNIKDDYSHTPDLPKPCIYDSSQLVFKPIVESDGISGTVITDTYGKDIAEVKRKAPEEVTKALGIKCKSIDCIKNWIV